MNLDLFVKKLEENLETLEKEYSFSIEDFDIDNLHEEMKKVDNEDINDYLDEELLTFYLPKCDYDYSINIKELEQFVNELKSATLINNVECFTKQRFLVRIRPAYSESGTEYYSTMEYIDNKLDGAFLITANHKGVDCKCRIVSGETIFGVMIASLGAYDEYFPPVLSDDLFVEIAFLTKEMQLNDARDVFKAFIFELSASLCLDFSISARPEFIDYDDETKKEFSDKIRPLISGKGLSEPLNLYHKAIESPSADISILYFTKVIEFISQTVIRINLIDKVRTKLLSPRALNPEADFITELGSTYENNKIYKRDKDAIKVTISTCCDASELSGVIPSILKKQWFNHLKKGDEEIALNNLATSIVATRNSIAHAKANYVPTGNEIPESDFDSLSECLKICVQQSIRWYANRHESQRVF